MACNATKTRSSGKQIGLALGAKRGVIRAEPLDERSLAEGLELGQQELLL